MKRDIRESALYQEAESYYERLRAPGTGQISDAADVSVSPSGQLVAFTGTLMDTLDGGLLTRICLTDLTTGKTQILTFGPNTDRLPKFSPDGESIAFLSDRHRAGDFQLYILNLTSGAAISAPHADGWVEYFAWSPNGRRILLGVAGHGADIAGGQGAITSKKLVDSVPSWVPSVDTGDEHFHWRHAWIYELKSGRVHRVAHEAGNIWESSWCGDEALAAVASTRPDEGSWYVATVKTVDLETGACLEVYRPETQLSALCGSPSGAFLSIVEALASDRLMVAGDPYLLERASGRIRPINTNGIDVAYAEWRSAHELLLAGHRSFESVVGMFDARSGKFWELWSSCEITTGGRYISVSGMGSSGDFALVGESFLRAPEIAIVKNGEYRTIKSFRLETAERIGSLGAPERLRWDAADGLEIDGWLLRPRGEGPYPLVMNIHGGPVWHWRPTWLGRGSPALLMLLEKGYAVFFPNPRGSGGRGQAFARMVLGEMGGADTYDLTSGLDYLISGGLADSSRLGVTGGSYGGFMASWLIGQDQRFAAAVPVAPFTNQVSEHLNSNIGHCVALFLADSYTNPNGKYFQRSPIMHAHKVKTPTLNICGALDRCTPAEEARQFHNALLENDTRSVLVTYPEEGHGIRKPRAAMDCAARMVAWFQEHMPATS